MQLSYHLRSDSLIRAEMTTHSARVAPFETFSLQIDDLNLVIFGQDNTPEQLLGLARSVEQAARAWQMERDGVGEGDAAKVLAVQS